MAFPSQQQEQQRKQLQRGSGETHSLPFKPLFLPLGEKCRSESSQSPKNENCLLGKSAAIFEPADVGLPRQRDTLDATYQTRYGDSNPKDIVSTSSTANSKLKKTSAPVHASRSKSSESQSLSSAPAQPMQLSVPLDTTRRAEQQFLKERMNALRIQNLLRRRRHEVKQRQLDASAEQERSSALAERHRKIQAARLLMERGMAAAAAAAAAKATIGNTVEHCTKLSRGAVESTGGAAVVKTHHSATSQSVTDHITTEAIVTRCHPSNQANCGQQAKVVDECNQAAKIRCDPQSLIPTFSSRGRTLEVRRSQLSCDGHESQRRLDSEVRESEQRRKVPVRAISSRVRGFALHQSSADVSTASVEPHLKQLHEGRMNARASPSFDGVFAVCDRFAPTTNLKEGEVITDVYQLPHEQCKKNFSLKEPQPKHRMVVPTPGMQVAATRSMNIYHSLCSSHQGFFALRAGKAQARQSCWAGCLFNYAGLTKKETVFSQSENLAPYGKTCQKRSCPKRECSTEVAYWERLLPLSAETQMVNFTAHDFVPFEAFHGKAKRTPLDCLEEKQISFPRENSLPTVEDSPQNLGDHSKPEYRQQLENFIDQKSYANTKGSDTASTPIDLKPIREPEAPDKSKLCAYSDRLASIIKKKSADYSSAALRRITKRSAGNCRILNVKSSCRAAKKSKSRNFCINDMPPSLTRIDVADRNLKNLIEEQLKNAVCTSKKTEADLVENKPRMTLDRSCHSEEARNFRTSSAKSKNTSCREERAATCTSQISEDNASPARCGMSHKCHVRGGYVREDTGNGEEKLMQQAHKHSFRWKDAAPDGDAKVKSVAADKKAESRNLGSFVKKNILPKHPLEGVLPCFRVKSGNTTQVECPLEKASETKTYAISEPESLSDAPSSVASTTKNCSTLEEGASVTLETLRNSMSRRRLCKGSGLRRDTQKRDFPYSEPFISHDEDAPLHNCPLSKVKEQFFLPPVVYKSQRAGTCSTSSCPREKQICDIVACGRVCFFGTNNSAGNSMANESNLKSSQGDHGETFRRHAESCKLRTDGCLYESDTEHMHHLHNSERTRCFPLRMGQETGLLATNPGRSCEQPCLEHNQHLSKDACNCCSQRPNHNSHPDRSTPKCCRKGENDHSCGITGSKKPDECSGSTFCECSRDKTDTSFYKSSRSRTSSRENSEKFCDCRSGSSSCTSAHAACKDIPNCPVDKKIHSHCKLPPKTSPGHRDEKASLRQERCLGHSRGNQKCPSKPRSVDAGSKGKSTLSSLGGLRESARRDLLRKSRALADAEKRVEERLLVLDVNQKVLDKHRERRKELLQQQHLLALLDSRCPSWGETCSGCSAIEEVGPCENIITPNNHFNSIKLNKSLTNDTDLQTRRQLELWAEAGENLPKNYGGNMGSYCGVACDGQIQRSNSNAPTRSSTNSSITCGASKSLPVHNPSANSFSGSSSSKRPNLNSGKNNTKEVSSARLTNGSASCPQTALNFLPPLPRRQVSVNRNAGRQTHKVKKVNSYGSDSHAGVAASSCKSLPPLRPRHLPALQSRISVVEATN